MLTNKGTIFLLYLKTIQKESSIFNLKWCATTSCCYVIHQDCRINYFLKNFFKKMLPSISLLNEIIETSISVNKTADLLYHIGSLSNNVMLVSYKINKKLQKYGIEFLHKLMCYVRYLLFSIFQINFVAYWLCYLMPSRYAPSLCPFETPPYSKFKFLFWRKNYV